MISSKQGGALLLLAFLSLPCRLQAAPAQFDIDVKELDQQRPAPAPKTETEKQPQVKTEHPKAKKEQVKAKKEQPKAKKEQAKAQKEQPKVKKEPEAAAKSAPVQPVAETPEYLRYTVKPGDHIFKILVVRFGMSNEAAERLIPEIIRVNKVSNIKRLTVGQTLLIPHRGHQEQTAKSAKKMKRVPQDEVAESIAVSEAPSKFQAQGPAASSGPAKVVQAPVASAPQLVPPPALPPLPAPAPKPAATQAPAAVSPVAAARPQAPVAPAVVSATTWVCSVTEGDAAGIVDAELNALSVPWSRNRIIQSAEGASNAYSIRVDRYFEYKGGRYIVSIGQSDPYSYTLIRILEGAGYKALRVSGGEDFQAVSEKLFKLIGVAPDFGKHVLQGGHESAGFLVQQDDAGGRQVLITGQPVAAQQRWLLAPGCGAR